MARSCYQSSSSSKQLTPAECRRSNSLDKRTTLFVERLRLGFEGPYPVYTTYTYTVDCTLLYSDFFPPRWVAVACACICMNCNFAGIVPVLAGSREYHSLNDDVLLDRSLNEGVCEWCLQQCSQHILFLVCLLNKLSISISSHLVTFLFLSNNSKILLPY